MNNGFYEVGTRVWLLAKNTPTTFLRRQRTFPNADYRTSDSLDPTLNMTASATRKPLLLPRHRLGDVERMILDSSIAENHRAIGHAVNRIDLFGRHAAEMRLAQVLEVVGN